VREPEEVTPLWLSHHWPDDYGRCVVVGGRHVCRRCLVLYPIALVAMVATLAGLRLPGPAEVAAMALLPLPALVDFAVEHLGRSAPSARRLVVVTVPLGVGLGIALGRYLEAPADPWFWGVVVAYLAVALATWLTGRRAPTGE
jgi:hypothetical protein